MKKMLFGACAVAAVIAAGAAIAQSSRVTEPKTGFSVAVPDGWRAGQMANMPIAHVAMIAPDAQTTGANCIIGAEETAATAGATQAQLNAELKTAFTEEFWRTNVFSGFTNVKFESTKAMNHPSGARTQEVTLTSDGPDASKPTPLKLTAMLMITPGVVFSATCGAKIPAYEAKRKTYRMVFDSLRPKGMGEAAVQPANDAAVVTAVAAKPFDPALAGIATKVTGALAKGPVDIK